jgi:hypothetical protein
MFPLPQLVVAAVLLKLAGVWIDPEHRWWMPISLHQGTEYWFAGEAVIWTTCLAAAIVLRRMIRTDDWYEFLPFGVVFLLHVQLCFPWGRVGPVHDLTAFLTMGGYSAFMLTAGVRHRDLELKFYGGVLVALTLAAFVALPVLGNIPVFGVIEQLLVLCLLLTFRYYDSTNVQIALNARKRITTKAIV